MNAQDYIARRLGFGKGLTAAAVAVSFFTVTAALAVSGGFRYEIRTGIRDICGDVLLTSASSLAGTESGAVPDTLSYMQALRSTAGVAQIVPSITRAGIVKMDSLVQGVVFKGTGRDSLGPMEVSIPRKLSAITGLEPGDRMLCYFVGDKVKARKFKVASTYDGIVDGGSELIVKTSVADLQRLNGWGPEDASAFEVILDARHSGRDGMRAAASELGAIASMYAEPGEIRLFATAACDRYAALFSWLQLIDGNVAAILVLMIIVAAFNMSSGLLILLFRNTSTIGTLKSLGMRDRDIAGLFRKVSAKLLLIGMAVGEALALLFCLIEDKTHFFRLDPANYFVSYVPVRLNMLVLLGCDALAFALILLALRIPAGYISKIDPAVSIKAE